jgi:uncharacterized protein (DUF3084 family)
MTTGLVLIAAVLVLGGVIATMGDRIGMRVGKARLSLFNLRPRQTATIITVLTGVIISASTFALLFAVSDQLRTGVFDLQEIQDDLATARDELNEARRQRSQVQTELQDSRTEQREAQQRLREINRSLERAINQRNRIESALDKTQQELSRTEANFRQAQSQLEDVSQQANSLREEIEALEAEREAQIAQRDQEIAEREQRLQELENQRASLIREVERLEEERRALREGNVVLLRNQTLASGVIRVIEPSAAPQAVDQLLREANRFALGAILPGTTTEEVQIIQITNSEVEELINEIQDGRDYVVRILSENNYLIGEPCVLAGQACILVSAEAIPNEIIFQEGEVLAATSVNPNQIETQNLVDRIELLIAASQFRAQRAGVVTNTVQIAYGREEIVSRFFAALQQLEAPVEIRTVAAEPIYTAGPIIVHLAAVQGDRLLFDTDNSPPLLF